MDSLPSTPSDPSVLPQGCQQLGRRGASPLHEESLHPWKSRDQLVDLLLVLAATQTAEHEGISAAGSTAASRRFTALADAELLIHGPAGQRRWPLPSLPAGVSPALLSHVAARRLKLNPQVAALGLTQRPDFPTWRLKPWIRGHRRVCRAERRCRCRGCSTFGDVESSWAGGCNAPWCSRNVFLEGPQPLKRC